MACCPAKPPSLRPFSPGEGNGARLHQIFAAHITSRTTDFHLKEKLFWRGKANLESNLVKKDKYQSMPDDYSAELDGQFQEEGNKVLCKVTGEVNSLLRTGRLHPKYQASKYEELKQKKAKCCLEELICNAPEKGKTNYLDEQIMVQLHTRSRSLV